MSQKKLVLINQINQKSGWYVIIGTLKILVRYLKDIWAKWL